MPPIKRYTIEETREVRLSALDPFHAAHLASRVFKGDDKLEDQINILSEVRTTDVTVREEL
jgi:hypothetical protein